MNKQIIMSFVRDELKEIKTHKREFLEKIKKIISWDEFEDLIRLRCYDSAWEQVIQLRN